MAMGVENERIIDLGSTNKIQDREMVLSWGGLTSGI